LRLHQKKSGPVMGRLKKWMHEEVKERKVEPNSGLGEAFRSMQNHWNKLVKFLQVADAPLDNNVVERSLKKVRVRRTTSGQAPAGMLPLGS
jgi:hypothetical protein